MNIVDKIRNLPESKRKVILWVIIIILAAGLLTWWVKNLQQRLKSFKTEELKEQLKLPSFEEKLKGLPKVEIPKLEIPEISKEELKKLEEQLKETEKQVPIEEP